MNREENLRILELAVQIQATTMPEKDIEYVYNYLKDILRS